MFVPEENLLGREHEGFYLIMANFQWERLLMALGAVGAMQVAFEQTLAYAGASARRCGRARSERAAGGASRRTDDQAIRHKLAEIAVTIEAGRAVTYAALRRYVAGEDAVREVTIAKLATQRSAFDVIDTCLQIHGGAGYMVESEIERAARDARLGPIGGGTDEIMKEILGRSLGLWAGRRWCVGRGSGRGGRAARVGEAGGAEARERRRRGGGARRDDEARRSSGAGGEIGVAGGRTSTYTRRNVHT